MEMFRDVIVSGMGSGILYGLVALAFVLVLKSTDVVNFFTGDTAALGAYFVIFFTLVLQLSMPIAIVAAILCSVATTVILERVGLRPMYKVSFLQVVIGTVALSIIIRAGIRLYFGPVIAPYPYIYEGIPKLRMPGIVLSSETLWMMIIAVILIAGFTYFYRFTRWGTALRACCQDRRSASLMGVNVGAMISLAWGLAGAIGAIMGMAGAHLIQVYPEMGLIGLKGFCASILGGTNSIPGALLGGIILGVVENVGGFYISFAYRDLIAYVIMIVVLIWRPRGLLGKSVVRKV